MVLEGLIFHRIARQTRQWISHYKVCLENSTDRAKLLGKLQLIITPHKPFHIIAIDFIVRLPKEALYLFWKVPDCKYPFDTIITVTYKWSRKSILIPGSVHYTAK